MPDPMSSVAPRITAIYRDLHDLGYFNTQTLIRPGYKQTRATTETTAGAAPDAPAVGPHEIRRDQ